MSDLNALSCGRWAVRLGREGGALGLGVLGWSSEQCGEERKKGATRAARRVAPP